MPETQKFVVFRLDDQQFALELLIVERILPGMEIHSLPLSPEYLSGTINYQGEFLPVVNLRKLFLLPDRDLELNDQLIVTASPGFRVVLWVNEVMEIVELADEEISVTEKIMLNVNYVSGSFKLHDGLVLIHDLKEFFTPGETARLEAILKKQKKPSPKTN